MPITIKMIETKEFATKPQGYDPLEVDEFLDAIADDIERMQKETQALRQELEAARRAPQAPAQARGGASDSTIHNMLTNAQRVCDETIADAKKQAQDTLREAQQEADGITREARNDLKRLNDDLEALRSAAQAYRDRFKRLVDEQTRILDSVVDL